MRRWTARSLQETGVKLNMEQDVESYQFRYVSMGSSEVGSGLVLINLERKDGVQFGVVLSADDAKRLFEDLPDQVRIASQISN